MTNSTGTPTTLSTMPKRALAATTSAVEAMRVRASIVFFSVSSTRTAGTAYTAIMASSMTVATRMNCVRAPRTSMAALSPPVFGGSVRRSMRAGGGCPARVSTLRPIRATATSPLSVGDEGRTVVSTGERPASTSASKPGGITRPMSTSSLCTSRSSSVWSFTVTKVRSTVSPASRGMMDVSLVGLLETTPTLIFSAIAVSSGKMKE